jgi:iron(III) transport system permease protein
MPILSLIVIAMQGSDGLWPHLFSYVLPVAARDTLTLLLGVGVMVSVIGAATAWIVTAYDFRGRGLLEWALLLPLAVPTYIVAYAYLDILHPVGAVQGAVRNLLGYASPAEFRLPEIRSMWACIVLLGLVLYPYVYLTPARSFSIRPPISSRCRAPWAAAAGRCSGGWACRSGVRRSPLASAWL